ncbi:MAG: hypothetical protein JNK78_00305 [Planctomycetes bacterium]|nr:hypothetical protein [Planctomycetota bacterium]
MTPKLEGHARKLPGCPPWKCPNSCATTELTTAIAEGTIGAAEWAETCRRHGIGEEPLSGPAATT